MEIRKGEYKDCKVIAEYLLYAMQEIVYQFIGGSDHSEALDFMETLVGQSGNQYAYDNCWLIEDNEEILGVALTYDGALIAKLREPVATLVNTRYLREFNPEFETEAGEIYLDCIAVNPAHRGKGIGRKLLDFLIDYYVYQGEETLGLLVEKSNPKAKKLYERQGFRTVGKKELLGISLEHMQIKSH